MSARKAKTKLFLTARALRDIAEVERFSITQFGKRTADKYIAELEAALIRLQENPGLLHVEEELHPALQFYRAKKHLLVCDVQPEAIFLLTVVHASRDIPSRLSELEPTLALESTLLHKKLRQGKME